MATANFALHYISVSFPPEIAALVAALTRKLGLVAEDEQAFLRQTLYLLPCALAARESPKPIESWATSLSSASPFPATRDSVYQGLCAILTHYHRSIQMPSPRWPGSIEAILAQPVYVDAIRGIFQAERNKKTYTASVMPPKDDSAKRMLINAAYSMTVAASCIGKHILQLKETVSAPAAPAHVAAEPANPVPVAAEPMAVEPARPAPVAAEPVKPAPAAAEPVKPAPAAAEPIVAAAAVVQPDEKDVDDGWASAEEDDDDLETMRGIEEALALQHKVEGSRARGDDLEALNVMKARRATINNKVQKMLADLGDLQAKLKTSSASVKTDRGNTTRAYEVYKAAKEIYQQTKAGHKEVSKTAAAMKVEYDQLIGEMKAVNDEYHALLAKTFGAPAESIALKRPRTVDTWTCEICECDANLVTQKCCGECGERRVPEVPRAAPHFAPNAAAVAAAAAAAEPITSDNEGVGRTHADVVDSELADSSDDEKPSTAAEITAAMEPKKKRAKTAVKRQYKKKALEVKPNAPKPDAPKRGRKKKAKVLVESEAEEAASPAYTKGPMAAYLEKENVSESEDDDASYKD